MTLHSSETCSFTWLATLLALFYWHSSALVQWLSGRVAHSLVSDPTSILCLELIQTTVPPGLGDSTLLAGPLRLQLMLSSGSPREMLGTSISYGHYSHLSKLVDSTNERRWLNYFLFKS